MINKHNIQIVYEKYKYHIFLFVIIIVLILLKVNVFKNIATIIALPFLHTKKSGGYELKSKPEKIKNILIVDVANMYVGWYMEKYKKKTMYNTQNKLIEGYIDCMRDHYNMFVKKNNIETDNVNYILKNYRYINGKKDKMSATDISKEIWDKFNSFVKKHTGSHITVAEDYNLIPYTDWKSPKMHYLRGRDDYLCFRMAQHYKKKYINSVIMSDDKYRDYEQFGFVPEFKATYIHSEWVDDYISDPKIIQSNELIKPRPNTLGQMNDYRMVKITMEFSFNDIKFLKTSDYKIAKAGHIWDKIS